MQLDWTLLIPSKKSSAKLVAMSEKQKDESIKPKITSAHDYKAYFRQALDASKRQPFTDFQIAAFVTVIAGLVRLYKIWEPTSVV